MAKAGGLQNVLPKADTAMQASLQQFAARTAFTISSSRDPDMPIIFVSPEFCKMTGYTEKEILGRNCRFLQGPGTSRQAVQELRNCIQEDRGCTVCLMNYTKDGKPFWNQLCLAPVRDETGVSCYLGIQTNVTGSVLAYRNQQFSPFQTNPAAGPHGGVHSYECSEIVAVEKEAAKRLEGTIKRWHSEKLMSIPGSPSDYRPVSSKSLPTSLLAPLHKMHQSFVLSDPNVPDMPIVHASEGFLKLTGRPRNEVVGHNCRFMNGPLTDQAELDKLRAAIQETRPITVRLLNYRSDGELFWNHLHVAPIRNAEGKVVFFVGCQMDITVHRSKRDRRHSADAYNPSKSEPHQARGDPIPTFTPGADIGTIPEDRIQAETHLSTQHTIPREVENLDSDTKPKLDGLLSVLHGASPEGFSLSQAQRDDQGTTDATHGASNRERLGAAASQQVPEAVEILSPAAKQNQRSVIGTVRVVCRSLSTKTGLRRSLEDQHLPHGVNDCAILRNQIVNGPSAVLHSRSDVPTVGSSHI